MTDHNREEREALIEKAAKVLWDEILKDHGSVGGQVWAGCVRTATLMLDVFEQAHTPTSDERDEPEQTEFYEVMGGQGLMRIAKNLTREQAEEVREKFDRDCHRYGLMNPPTRINKQHGRYR